MPARSGSPAHRWTSWRVFLQAVPDEALLSGWAIAKATKRSGPTGYGVLDRLEDPAWITGR